MPSAPDAPSIAQADLAAMRAARAWGFTPDASFWAVLSPERRDALRAAAGAVGDQDPADARASLRAEHVAQARPDSTRVHASWWARALQDEPRSVRLAVLANLPPRRARALRAAIGPQADAPATADAPAAPFAVDAALTLWTERLVGDLPDRDDDPPAIAALSRLRSGPLSRLFHAAGLAKWSAAAAPPPRSQTPDDAARLARLCDRLADLDPRAVPAAARDLASLDPDRPQAETRLGMLTFARLLALADPHRTRWALQHIPYPSARSIRRTMERQPPRTALLARFETRFLRAAWLDLLDSGEVDEPWTWGDAP